MFEITLFDIVCADSNTNVIHKKRNEEKKLTVTELFDKWLFIQGIKKYTEKLTLGVASTITCMWKICS